jgi:hypothetical protein
VVLTILQVDLSGGTFLGGWVSAALVALLVSFGIIAIAFAIGIGFDYKELEEWAKKEMYEIFISGLIVGILVAFVSVLFSISTSLAGGDPFEVAHSNLSQMLYDTAGVYLSLFLYNMYVAAVSTLTIGFFIPIIIPEVLVIRIGSMITPEAGFSAITTGLDTMFNLLSAMIGLLLVQQVLLDFFKVVMFKYFLPLGVLMRSFSFTRVAGATIIAVAVCAYIIYPLALIYSYGLYSSFKAVVVVGQPSNPMGNLVVGPILWDITGPIQALGSMMRNFVIVSVCFLVTAVITLSSVSSLAGALGGDPELFGLARLV